jgi:Glycosyl transferases group 1
MTGDLVVLFKGHSQYGSVNTMVDQLAAAFRRCGVQTLVLDTLAADCVPTIVTLVRQRRVRMFLSLNGYGIPAADQGAGFYAESPAPAVIYFVDHPAVHYPRIRVPLPHLIVTFPTPHHVDFCRQFIRDDIPIHHLPHATVAADPAPWNERDVPIFLSASAMADPEPFRASWAQHGPGVAAQLNAMADAHLASPSLPLHEHVIGVLASTPPIEVLASYFATIDTYLRGRIKRDLVAALNYLPLTVCGDGWERVKHGPGRAVVLPAMTALESVVMMRRAKLVLNPLPAYYESHERPLQAAANGAVATNGPSGWLTRTFSGGLLPLPADIAGAAAMLEAALGDDERLQAIAEAGHRTCIAGHLWDHRAAEILRLAEG